MRIRTAERIVRDVRKYATDYPEGRERKAYLNALALVQASLNGIKRANAGSATWKREWRATHPRDYTVRYVRTLVPNGSQS